MSLSDQQFQFIKDVNLLLSFAFNEGWKVTAGELWRPEEMQKIYYKQGKSETLNSLHRDKLAVDLNFFKPIYDASRGGLFVIEYKLTYDKKELQKFGDFWESLSIKNEWGGNWKSLVDTDHFQRNKI